MPNETMVQLMKPISCIVLMCIAWSLSSEAAKAGVFVRGVPTCSEWSAARELAAEDRFRDERMRTWLLGFLSGLAIGQNKEFWGDANALDNDSVYQWVDNYCLTNSAKGLDDAGAMLFIERTRGK